MPRHSVLLIISGSVAAYKSLDLIRRLKEQGVEVRCILTDGGAQFITPLSVASLSGQPVYSDLFSLKDEAEMGHIRLSREAGLIVVAPASADLIAKMATGRADDLASAVLLASDKKVLVVPAMNTQMWAHKATQRNVAQIVADGVEIIAPGEGELACGEIGAGRMAEVEVIVAAVMQRLKQSPMQSQVRGEEAAIGSYVPIDHSNAYKNKSLAGVSALVTSGPTHEAIDPVRFIGNRSSGKQGHAIAAALAALGAQVTLVTGPTSLADPAGVTVRRVTSAEEMLTACEACLPAQVAVCAAAVGDWKVSVASSRKLKKQGDRAAPALELVENPDILYAIAHHAQRPALVVGFAAETEDLLQNATDKLRRKGCDWIVANDVSGGKGFDADHNEVSLITKGGHEDWPGMGKDEIAKRLAERIAAALKGGK